MLKMYGLWQLFRAHWVTDTPHTQTHRHSRSAHTHRHKSVVSGNTHKSTNTHTHTQPPTYTPHTHKLTHTISEHVTKTRIILSRGPGISVHLKLNIHFFNYMGMDNAKHIKHNGFPSFWSFGLSQAGSPPPLVARRILSSFCETLKSSTSVRM